MAKVKVDSSGMKAFNRSLKKLTTTNVEAGIISDAKHPNFDGSVSQLAAMWHYGFKRDLGSRGMVEFSSDFFNPLMWYNLIQDKGLKQLLIKDVSLYLDGKISKNDMFSRIGAYLSDELKEHILSGAANIITSDQGIGKSNNGITMIDTGELVNASTYEVVNATT